MPELMMIFAKGFVIGLSLALVIGPIAILCIQQTLVHGFYAGIACGLGIATADGLYGALAGLGLSFMTEILHSYQLWFHIFGGCILLYLGLRTFTRSIVASSLSLSATRFFNMYFSTLVLTLSNPITFITLSALLASLDVGRNVEWSILLPTLFFGFFFGSLLWWVLLTCAISLFRGYISIRTLTIINKVAGIVMIVFGIGVFISLLVCSCYR